MHYSGYQRGAAVKISVTYENDDGAVQSFEFCVAVLLPARTGGSASRWIVVWYLHFHAVG